jgi:hypothetical protein
MRMPVMQVGQVVVFMRHLLVLMGMAVFSR